MALPTLTRTAGWLAGAALAIGLVYAAFFHGYVVGELPVLLGDRLPIDTLTVPPGVAVTVYAHPVEGARSLTLGEDGVVYVGTRQTGKVYALVDRDRDHRAETVLTIARGLTQPNGVAIKDGALYVAEIGRVVRYDDIAKTRAASPRPQVVRGDLPRETHHGWRFIAFGPDGKLYVPVGAPCNVCARSDARFASILRMNDDGSGLEVFAQGIRNTVGFDWQPGTNVLWFTDNGRDWLGDDGPPDELNRAPEPDMHFGFPFCHGRDTQDPEHAGGHRCSEFTPPVAELGPHVAALGLRFYAGPRASGPAALPAAYRDGVFIAEHGSWNRSTPTGYRVRFVPVNGARAGRATTFAAGWLDGAVAWGRPVDVLVMPDGALLVSDDKANAVYRFARAR